MEKLEAMFGRRLKQLRRERSLTQQDLAAKAKLDDKHLGALERGEKAPSFGAIERLAKALKVEAYEFFLPEKLSSGQLEQSLSALLADASRIDKTQLNRFFSDLLMAIQKLETHRKDQ